MHGFSSDPPLIMGPQIFQIKLSLLNCAIWDLILGTLSFISQKVKKLKEEDNQPFGPTGSPNSLKQSYLHLHPPWF